MGTLLVNERMLETYIYARDKFLKPGGRMFPQIGRIHAAAFSDPLLYGEVAQKAAFWQQPAFYGVNVTCLFEPAAEGYFSQVRLRGRRGRGCGAGRIGGCAGACWLRVARVAGPAATSMRSAPAPPRVCFA
jgi:hypothetical protein